MNGATISKMTILFTPHAKITMKDAAQILTTHQQEKKTFAWWIENNDTFVVLGDPKDVENAVYDILWLEESL